MDGFPSGLSVADVVANISSANGKVVQLDVLTLSYDDCQDAYGFNHCGRCTLVVNIPVNPDGNKSGLVSGSIIASASEPEESILNFSFYFDGSYTPSILSISPSFSYAGQSNYIEVRRGPFWT